MCKLFVRKFQIVGFWTYATVKKNKTFKDVISFWLVIFLRLNDYILYNTFKEYDTCWFHIECNLNMWYSVTWCYNESVNWTMYVAYDNYSKQGFRIYTRCHVWDRSAESRRVQASEQWCLPAIPASARGETESACEEQQAHMALPGKRSSPNPPRHQGEVRKNHHYLGLNVLFYFCASAFFVLNELLWI